MPNINQDTGEFIYENYLPHNYVAEKIILSSLLISSEAIEIVLRSVKVETFYFHATANHTQTPMLHTRLGIIPLIVRVCLRCVRIQELLLKHEVARTGLCLMF